MDTALPSSVERVKPPPYKIDRMDLQQRTISITFRADVIGTAARLLENTTANVTGQETLNYQDKRPNWVSLESLGAKLKIIGHIFYEQDIDAQIQAMSKHLNLSDIVIGPTGEIMKH